MNVGDLVVNNVNSNFIRHNCEQKIYWQFVPRGAVGTVVAFEQPRGTPALVVFDDVIFRIAVEVLTKRFTIVKC